MPINKLTELKKGPCQLDGCRRFPQAKTNLQATLVALRSTVFNTAAPSANRLASTCKPTDRCAASRPRQRDAHQSKRGPGLLKLSQDGGERVRRARTFWRGAPAKRLHMRAFAGAMAWRAEGGVPHPIFFFLRCSHGSLNPEHPVVGCGVVGGTGRG